MSLRRSIRDIRERIIDGLVEELNCCPDPLLEGGEDDDSDVIIESNTKGFCIFEEKDGKQIGPKYEVQVLVKKVK